jgi:putative FmdB family regulatory protein
MPTYQYRCSSCGYEHEVFQRMTEDPLKTCPECEKDSFERVISAEGGFLLKGSGFYSTDYCGSKSSKGSEAPSGGCSTGSCPFAK